MAENKKNTVAAENTSLEYAMWGNGVALPCVFYVLNGIANMNGALKSAPL